ncbi:hypothetical protein LOAG_13778 [Loa loa]|uniref:Uncharacterized protein n=1 Tax=Loa loa TaxID=7209 RepID=A0A1S0TIZ3_LOALO|nr:hypothetical protein LOAG_13778 [Loa loa]EFO14738.2 hypothetical protein LOAG_13778 [Loa loa]
MEDTVKYLKEKLEIEESEVKPPDEMRSLIGQRCNEQDKRFANWESGIRCSTGTCMRIKCFYCGSGHNSALYRKRSEMKKQSENFKNGEKANINSKKVAATVADDSIREAINGKQIEFKTSPSVGMLTAGMVETRKYENRKITFGVQTLSENVKNIQVQIVDSILEQIPYVINNERGQLAEGKWGKPYVLLGV